MMRGIADDTPITVDARGGWATLALTVVAFGSAWFAFRDHAPPLQKLVWAGLAGATLSAFVVALIAFQFASREPRVLRRWLRIAEGLRWAIWLTVQGIIWLLMPWGPTVTQLGTLLFATGYMAANFLSSLDAPIAGRLRVVTVALSLVAATVLHQIELWPYLVAYLLCLGIVMTLLSAIIDRAIAQLRAARAEAEAARDARTQFMAAASHDLGQPLQAARLFFEQVLAAPDAARRDTSATNTRSALAAMERLIRQMLDHLRVDEGALAAEIAPFDVRAVICAVTSQFAPLAQLSGIAIRVVPGNAITLGDATLVERALGNLVDNALRHSGGQRVLIGARLSADKVRLLVIDDGRGLPPGDAQRLFEPFAQGAGDGRPHGGLGIGLSSVRALMALTGGSADTDPRWHRGAAFYLELPREI